MSEVHNSVSVASYSVDEFVLIARALRDRCAQPLTTVASRTPPPPPAPPSNQCVSRACSPARLQAVRALMHVPRLHPPRVEAAGAPLHLQAAVTLHVT